MCHRSVLEFGPRVIKPEHVRNKRVLEVGSRNVNGSLRAHVVSLEPTSYVGVDIQGGPGVDTIYSVEEPDFCAAVGGPFDFVVCTEVLEHVRDWRAAVDTLKRCLWGDGGRLLVTTRSLGFKLHEYPGDYWRYELEDMRRIFGDFRIDVLEPDPQAPGVFFYGAGGGDQDWSLRDIKLYSMVTREREP